MTLSDQALGALLKRLHLANTRRGWRELTRRAEKEELRYRDFLALLVAEEIAQRQQTRLARLVRRARFPFLKTIDDFNFLHQSTVRLATRLGARRGICHRWALPDSHGETRTRENASRGGDRVSRDSEWL
jgi:DNA replication protein DnaC